MESLEKLDKKFIWHPFTQSKEWEKEIFEFPVVISKGKGVYLYDSRGKKYMDGISSLWANLHGHQHPSLDKALSNQLKKIAHSTFLGLTHEPGIRLAKELIEVAPKGLTRLFYSDNGSTAVEVALKMSYQYQLQKNNLKKSKSKNPKKLEFLALKNSYHGDTLGSVSVGGIELFQKKYKPLLFKTNFVMSPHCLRCPFRKKNLPAIEQQVYSYSNQKPKPGDFRAQTACHWQCLKEVEDVLNKKNKKIIAGILEPIVQGAGGMIVMPEGYLWGFANLCKKYNVPWIADEVAVGFGRTGTLFACEQEKVTPDFLCLAKGISGGYLPLAATITKEKVYLAFKAKYEKLQTFFHGHTYTANTLACAVSRANLKIFKEEKVLSHIKKLEVVLSHHLKELLQLPQVGQVRQAGIMAGIELVQDKKSLKPFPLSLRVGRQICLKARNKGLILRPLGDVIVVLPPLAIKEKELVFLMRGIKQTLQEFFVSPKFSV